MMAQPDMSEKLTLNVGVVELGQIDVLVSEGFYQNRTDFMRTAIRQLLLAHGDTIKQVTHRKTLTVGVSVLDRRTLERARDNHERLEVRAVGLVQITPDVDPDLARATIAHLSCFGALRMPSAVREALADRID